MLARAGAHLLSVALLLLVNGRVGDPALAAEGRGGAPPAPRQSASFDGSSGYTVKPSEIVVPADVPLGQYLRVTRPFPNWTLICDENLHKKQKVCNITQTILGPARDVVFSWSLAAAQNGQPFFILRMPPGVGATGTVTLDLRDGGPALAASVKGCDEHVCVAYQPVVPRLRAAVGKGSEIELSYAVASPPGTVAFLAPFAGLKAALAGI